MAAKQPSTTTQISKVELPKWVDEAAQSNYQLAQTIADKPYTAYTGQTVAGTSDLTQKAYDAIANNAGTAQGYTNQGADLISKAGGGILSMDRSAYTNPYTSEVVDNALQDLDKSRLQSLMKVGDAATSAGAFGGSRQGVMEGVTNSESAYNAGKLSAQLRSDAYDKATSSMQSDLASKLASGQGLLSAGTNLSDQNAKDVSQLLTGGASQQQQEQKVLDDAKSKWDDAQNYDLERLNILLSSLGMSPYGKTTTTNTTSQGGSSGFDPAQFSLGLLSIMGGVFSDRNAKTDIEKLGKDEETGLDLYAYRYKGDPKTYPKVVGPMAQDVAKKFPGRTKKVGGKLVIKGAQ